jgi:hypothetical protein
MITENCRSRFSRKPTLPGLMIGEQCMADVVKIADQRHVDAHLAEPLFDLRHCHRRLVAVDGDTHELGARACELGDLARGCFGIGGVGVRHRLHDDRRAAADHDRAHSHRHRMLARRGAKGRGFGGNDGLVRHRISRRGFTRALPPSYTHCKGR